ncbi:common antigen polymerase [Pseudoalteromonas sp. Scap03]|uniref:WzyE family oligosaccharide polymerase n=1 Tax=unclassified Pseudoalteromonas TaxID=194690 RepID=UPI0015C001E2|nr:MULTISPECIES: WzyE family oligosaccharide polymerase [unclassified Pseudoalteromonas]NWL15286.1 common antigen polymerase [Pseudoalteromonas sp. Scap03]QLE80438.1 common antigen polymerase [Pseudoalteromonas sp. Scap25]QLE88381.1 common antigen polymerase [Pseudoalteromonas sp. Scap06]
MQFEIAIVFVVSVSLLLLSLKLSNNRVGFYLLVSCFIYLTNFSWIPLNLAAGYFLGYEMLPDDILTEGLWWSTFFYSTFVILGYFGVRKISPVPLTIYDDKSRQVLITSSLAFFLISIFGYVFLNGMSFSAGNYGHRLSSSAGNGIFMIFFFLFIPAAMLILMDRKNFKGLFLALAVSVVGGMLVYFTLGGSRNILAAGIIGVIIIGQRLSLVSLKSIFFAALLLIGFINYLAFVRYGQGMSDDVIELGFRYLIDSLSPYDSFNKILEYFESGDEYYKGFDYVMAQFNPLIPRAFWPEKPVIPLTNALFFTESILGIHRGTYIISPTLLGGVYIMGGGLGIFLGCLVVVFITCALERMMFCNKPFLVLFSYTILPFSFFMVRESIELFFNKAILIFCTFLFIWLASMMILFIFERMSQANKLDKLTRVISE